MSRIEVEPRGDGFPFAQSSLSGLETIAPLPGTCPASLADARDAVLRTGLFSVAAYAAGSFVPAGTRNHYPHYPALVRRRSLVLAMPSCVPGYFQSPLTRLVLAMLDGIKLHNPLIESH